MADANYTYSIMEVSREQVLSKIAQYKYHVFCVKIATNEVKQSSELSTDELIAMTATTEWLYFVVKRKEA